MQGSILFSSFVIKSDKDDLCHLVYNDLVHQFRVADSRFPYEVRICRACDFILRCLQGYPYTKVAAMEANAATMERVRNLDDANDAEKVLDEITEHGCGLRFGPTLSSVVHDVCTCMFFLLMFFCVHTRICCDYAQRERNDGDDRADTVARTGRDQDSSFDGYCKCSFCFLDF
jgi:hypothetical protein